MLRSRSIVLTVVYNTCYQNIVQEPQQHIFTHSLKLKKKIQKSKQQLNHLESNEVYYRWDFGT